MKRRGPQESCIKRERCTRLTCGELIAHTYIDAIYQNLSRGTTVTSQTRETYSPSDPVYSGRLRLCLCRFIVDPPASQGLVWTNQAIVSAASSSLEARQASKQHTTTLHLHTISERKTGCQSDFFRFIDPLKLIWIAVSCPDDACVYKTSWPARSPVLSLFASSISTT